MSLTDRGQTEGLRCRGMQGDRRTEVLEGEPGVQSPCERGWAGVKEAERTKRSRDSRLVRRC